VRDESDEGVPASVSVVGLGAVISTPAGPLAVSLQLGNQPRSDPATTELLPGGATRVLWDWPDVARLRMLVGPLAPRAGRSSLVDALWGVVFSVEARTAVGPLDLSGVFVSPPDDAEGGVDSGERLAAVTVDLPDGVASLGTDDEEALHARTRLRGRAVDMELPLPSSWVPGTSASRPTCRSCFPGTPPTCTWWLHGARVRTRSRRCSRWRPPLAASLPSCWPGRCDNSPDVRCLQLLAPGEGGYGSSGERRAASTEATQSFQVAGSEVCLKLLLSAHAVMESSRRKSGSMGSRR
jgi:hypothetical protein